MFEKEIVEIYGKANICRYPIDLFQILRKKGYTLISYSDLEFLYGEKAAFIKRRFNDAVTDMDAKVVLYNDRRNFKRIRFTLAHELGHIILNDRNDEDGADNFAGEILAPSAVIRFKKFSTAAEISDFFNISVAASNIALHRSKSTDCNLDNIIIDYFRYIPHNNVVVSYQTLERVNRILAASTPSDRSSRFYEIQKMKRAAYDSIDPCRLLPEWYEDQLLERQRFGDDY